MAEINVTPLVDVMLVLLIVFMVTAPLLIPQSLGVKLPKTDSVQSPVDRDQMRLLVKPDGSMEMDGKSMGDKELRSMLTAKGADPNFQLQVEADENLKYGRLAEVMAMAQGAGDTTTAMAAGLAAAYSGAKVGHVEAGLRTFDRRQPFPEEINRLVVGVAADLHFAPTTRSRDNLLREAKPPSTGVTPAGSPHSKRRSDPTTWACSSRPTRHA